MVGKWWELENWLLMNCWGKNHQYWNPSDLVDMKRVNFILVPKVPFHGAKFLKQQILLLSGVTHM